MKIANITEWSILYSKRSNVFMKRKDYKPRLIDKPLGDFLTSAATAVVEHLK